MSSAGGTGEEQEDSDNEEESKINRGTKAPMSEEAKAEFSIRFTMSAPAQPYLPNSTM